jgi:cysteine desulfurase/selenocysteine lyase
VTSSAVRSTSGYDVAAVRREFPVLQETVNGHPLVYLDSAASAQKPQAVIDAERGVYERYYSNIHRGVHRLSTLATEAYENARDTIGRFLGASSRREVILLRGTTEAINLVAQSYGRRHVGPGDEVLITGLEHHSNIVPWQLLCEENEAVLKVAPIDDAGEVNLGAFERMLSSRTKIAAFAHVSNALGTINPIAEIISLAHARGIPVLVDGAQGAPHLPVDVQALDVDFYAFSGHKMFGPTGVGILYARSPWLEKMPPYQGGGSMISLVTLEKTHYAQPPYKFEAGTPDIGGGIALGAAIDYLTSIDLDAAAAHEQEVLAYGAERLASIKGLRLIGRARERAGVLSFVLDGIHPHDIGTILDREGVAIRAGHHCAMPIMQRYGVPATARASIAFYNTKEDIDALVRGILKVREVFG